MQPFFSIVVPTFNSRASLELMLRCLEAQTCAPADYECVVIDDGSTDGTAEFLKSYEPKFGFRHFVNRHNLGRAEARERGWQESRGEVLIFLDSDMLPAPDWLAGYHEAFAGGGLDAVCGMRFNLELNGGHAGFAQELARTVGVAPQELFNVNALDQFSRIEERARVGQYPHPVYEKLETEIREVYRKSPQSLLCAWTFIASNAAVRRSVLQETSGFNTCLRRFDDLELAIRLWEMGARFGFADGARAFHLREAGRPIYWPNMNDLLMMFSRHPYRLVLLMHFWMLYQAEASAAPPPAPFDKLSSLQRADEEAANLNLTERFREVYKQPFPVDCRYSREQVIAYYSNSPHWTREQTASGLDEAVSRGVYAERRDGEFYFDVYHTDNWLRDCTPILQRWLTRHVLNRNRTPFQNTQQPSDLLSFNYRGSYEVIIPAEAIAGVDGQVLLNVSLPVEHLPCQSNVRVTNCSPPNLLEYRDRTGGMAVNLPIMARAGEDVRIGYEFTCQLHEFAPVLKQTAALAPAELSKYLRPSLPPDYMAKAKVLLDQIVTDRTKDPYEIARMIYVWVQHQVVFIETPFMYPYYLMLDTGLGPCVQMTRLFINLCRLSGIPARELCGALLPQDVAQVLKDFSEGSTHDLELPFHGGTPFAHTWAEFYDPARGWIPIEIHGFGRKCVTPLNVPDKGLLPEIYEVYDEIKKPLLFGSMTPFRLYTSEQSNKLPAYPLVKRGVSMKPLQETASVLRYNLRCSLSPA